MGELYKLPECTEGEGINGPSLMLIFAEHTGIHSSKNWMLRMMSWITLLVLQEVKG